MLCQLTDIYSTLVILLKVYSLVLILLDIH